LKPEAVDIFIPQRYANEKASGRLLKRNFLIADRRFVYLGHLVECL
jgi:hypothetical protein